MKYAPRASLITLLTLLAHHPAGASQDSPCQNAECRERYTIEKLQMSRDDAVPAYRVIVMRPPQPPPARGYATLFLLDGNAVEQDIAAGRVELPAGNDAPAIVAIGYETAQRFEVAARTYDYTPPRQAQGSEFDPLNPERRAGGADVFIDFIEHTVKPAVSRRIPVDPARTGLWGHSYGGLFVLHTLLSRPTAFRCYIAASPSLWWQNGYLMNRQESGMEALTGTHFGLLVTRGTAEIGTRPANNDPQAQVRWQARTSVPPDAARDFAQRMKQHPGATVSHLEFDGLNHGQALTASLTPALLWFTRCAFAQHGNNSSHEYQAP